MHALLVKAKVYVTVATVAVLGFWRWYSEGADAHDAEHAEAHAGGHYCVCEETRA